MQPIPIPVVGVLLSTTDASFFTSKSIHFSAWLMLRCFLVLDVLKLLSPATPIVKIITALDCTVDFKERVNAFTTTRACTPSSDIKGGKADVQLGCEPAHNQCSIMLRLCTTITRRDSDPSHDCCSGDMLQLKV